MIKTTAKYMLVFCVAFALAGAAGYTGVSLFTKSAPEVILPDLVGKNIIQVLETLTRLGLNPKLYTTQYHDTIAKYGVTFQDPAPGATLKKGRDVIIYLSKGFKECRMPDLLRMTLTEAGLQLEANELKIGRVVSVYSERTRRHGIISQYPIPDTPVAASSSCNLLVSKGPRPDAMAMPDLVKMNFDQAGARIEALSLVLENIRTTPDPNRPPDMVIAQEPPSGSRVFKGARISLTVNHGTDTRVIDPEQFNQPEWIHYCLPPGFANRHVRIIMDTFGTRTEAFNGFMKSGKNINLLIPGGIKTKIRIFVDHKPVIVKDIDPWQPTVKLPWEYAAAPFF